jgi:hypothetical protein
MGNLVFLIVICQAFAVGEQQSTGLGSLFFRFRSATGVLGDFFDYRV